MITTRKTLFALKMFISAMIAYALAVKMGLENPYWAMVSCCVVSNPISGAVRARALYRFGGTFTAGMVTLIVSGLFINSPIILVVVIGLISSIMLGMSFLDRTQRAYFFQLGALTMMLITTATIAQPDNTFSIVVARVSEICLGVLSVTLIDSMIFPSSQEKTLHTRLKSWIRHLEKWQEASLTGKDNPEMRHEHLRILNDLASFNQMMRTLGYDYSVNKKMRQAAIAIQHRILQIIPLVSSAKSSIDTMPNALGERISEYVNAAVQQIKSTDYNRDLNEKLAASAENMSQFERIHLAEFIDVITQWQSLWQEVGQLADFVENQVSLPEPLDRQMMQIKVFTPAADFQKALKMFGGIICTYASLIGFWYATGWQQGPSMVLLGVVAIAMFGGTDNPSFTIGLFGRFVIISMVLGALLSYVLQPLANDYISFLIIMAIFIIPLAMWAYTNPMATLAMALSLSNVNFQAQYHPYDMGYYLETTAGTLLGVYVALLSSAVFQNFVRQRSLSRTMEHDIKKVMQPDLKIKVNDVANFYENAMSKATATPAFLNETVNNERIMKLVNLGVTFLKLKKEAAKIKNSPDYDILIKELLVFDLSRELTKPLKTSFEHAIDEARLHKEFSLIMLLIRARTLLFSYSQSGGNEK
ncbi:FUSC family protein [Serratia sp. M24T3]|uniref:FUSC family protein n=1 Tax=Serratia sp. M24T3 TaxID=932213 RepID=UPI00025BA2D7|nr:FUSC family protein [Serratia sp. M24T3]EIC86065.1 fusaric acid resistance protein [Serratia sp. M24T3]